uniref:CRAL/TRIO N-terminal domain-containing protein n=1 Tax=Nelumbo nucifera TaxID=4432 RepID=A0A822YLS7_NELNU|nr:TPA_asm: hypothetical protein HUJ06_011100 [Nelumbo nucifera]
MEKQSETAVAEMRKTVEKLGSSTEKHGDPTLMRFLVARPMDPNKAAKMFVQWQKCRAEFVPLGFIPESVIPDELNARKVYLQGITKAGHPLVIVKTRRHFPPKDHIQSKSE